MTEEADSAEETEVSIAVREKCTKRSALTAARNAKFLSSRQKEDPFFAGIASESTETKQNK